MIKKISLVITLHLVFAHALPILVLPLQDRSGYGQVHTGIYFQEKIQQVLVDFDDIQIISPTKLNRLLNEKQFYVTSDLVHEGFENHNSDYLREIHSPQCISSCRLQNGGNHEKTFTGNKRRSSSEVIYWNCS